PAGHQPTFTEGMERWKHRETHGDSDHAFGWKYLSEAQLWRSRNANARTLLGDLRLRVFLKSGLSFSRCAAFNLIYEELAQGQSLDVLTRCDSAFGYVLRAEACGDRTFHIEFGHRPHDGWNSGGEWLVKFDPSGALEDVELVRMWIDSD
ncbi:MAG: hypothetical protein KA004_03230, partial [Verrucomicrobiales bacterium]|nr:hypothetical protein [Verrucomicrobiales bacterium]